MALITINGTALPDTLGGTSFDELIRGFGGNDKLSGGGGNDQILGGDGDDILSGGDGNDYIVGGAGNDTMDGGAGFDMLDASFFGGGYQLNMITGVTNFAGETAINFEKVKTGIGNDSIFGNTANNVIILNSGNDFAFGDLGADTLRGNAGNDRLNGAFGNDRLEGGLGSDTFVFNTFFNASFNVDVMPDFSSADDSIALGAGVFTALPQGALSGNAFVIGPFATSPDHRVIYDFDKGDLYYDPDGVGGAAQIRFAHVAPFTQIDVSDLLVF